MSADSRTIQGGAGTPLARARRLLAAAKRRHLHGVVLVALCGCSWFTDFKEQPKIDPWDTPSDSVAPRGNPQGSVSIYGTAAPEFMYARNTQALESMSGLVNPHPVSQASIDRGRKAYQINCAVCHGPAAAGNGPVLRFGVFPPSLAAGSPAATQRTDGYIFAVIRNGKNLMPSYNRIEEGERWDIVNYLRALQGRAAGFTADTMHGRPGETGAYLVGATQTAPTRPAPYYAPIGAQAGAREGLTGTATSAIPRPTAGIPVPPDTAEVGRPSATRPPVNANRPPSPEARQ